MGPVSLTNMLSWTQNEPSATSFHTRLKVRWWRNCTIRNTFDAAVRFKPTPPAFRDINITCSRIVDSSVRHGAYHKSRERRNQGYVYWLLTILLLLPLNSFNTASLCFWDRLPSNRRNPIFFCFKGISNKSKNEVHWLKIMLFSPEPEYLICSKHSSRFDTFDDSFQFLLTSTLNLFSDGQVMSSHFFTICRHMGHNPVAGFLQLERRHSLHILWAHGVSTASSAVSRHMGHSVFSPRRILSTTSSTNACLGRLELWLTVSSVISRNLLVSFDKSVYFWESARLHKSKKNHGLI